ncbi:class I SAM-dependent methyltransferase [Mycolicibacterium sp. J2]|uniref:class I SAM-dependent methyltransferase n=1 Tax=Mycolicibacterium sp. J2 TaxID=2993511 RepID=UPI00224AFEFE|nr:class I SAM-dependent methyltransferase [Mycolicibacterium sp. J2]MCX2711116.1 class I SAM-dependent methyltransferase [Mycolicibacterium sp. J2]
MTLNYLTETPGTPGAVEYCDFTELWQGYDESVLALARREGVRAVAELGGGANPVVGDAQKWGFAEHRVVVDISEVELGKAAVDVRTRVADLCQPIEDELGTYDLVFSKMLCEHLPDPVVFHQNCFNLLRPGGLSVHFFPALGTFPFLVNKMIPEHTARRILDKVQPGRLDMPNLEKFPAYYRGTTGPTKTAFRKFEEFGFEVEQWKSSFGHTYYSVIPPLHALENAKSNFLRRHPIPRLASLSVIVLRKPA